MKKNKMRTPYFLHQRPTIKWKLACDANFATSREQVIRKIRQIKKLVKNRPDAEMTALSSQSEILIWCASILTLLITLLACSSWTAKPDTRCPNTLTALLLINAIILIVFSCLARSSANAAKDIVFGWSTHIQILRQLFNGCSDESMNITPGVEEEAAVP